MKTAINIQVGDRTYPFRMTLGAMLRFKRATGKDLAREELDDGDLEEVAQLLYACLASASVADKVPFNLSFEEFCDNLSAEDMVTMQDLLVNQEEPAGATDGPAEADGEEKKS